MKIAGITLKPYEPLCLCESCLAIKPAAQRKEKTGQSCACGGIFVAGRAVQKLIIAPDTFSLTPTRLNRLNKSLDDYMAGNLCPF